MMMTNKFFCAIALLNFLVTGAAGQEILFPLSCNPVIREYVKKNPGSDPSVLRRSPASLSLPFRDDFSGTAIYPDLQHWSDSDAFINQTYCSDPVTIGVATLDGIDKEGNPHDSNSTSIQPVICDYLTSQAIDLTTVSAADSVYFSFYYQPQGFGDEPEEEDSLVLEFYASDGVDSNWIHIWVANGAPNAPFSEVRIKIDSLAFFWAGFRFRFYNYANPNGNRDHWHLDYVRISANESAVEPLREIALVNPIQSYLKDFTAMPYSHYKSEVAAGNNPVKDSITDVVRLYTFTGTASIALNDTVKNRAGSAIFGAQSAPDLNPSQNTTDVFGIDLPPQLFDTTSGDMTDFTIKHEFTGLDAGDSANDANVATQHFHNYYSYDDGTAESATGVHVAYTKYAYRFDVKKADSLLGIQIYFNPWGKNVHLDLFSICLWSAVNVSANTETLVYQTIDNKPANNDSINGFVDYYFDTPIWVNAGISYIGIIQSSINEIGLGVDHNTDHHDKMFLNYNNQWYNSTISGSWMMRPIFGKMLTIGVEEIASSKMDFEVLPNPAGDHVVIQRERPTGNATVLIYSMLGEQVLTVPVSSSQLKTEINIRSLSPGVYFISLADGQDNIYGVRKLIISR